MFARNGNCTSIADVVYRNTGIKPEDFLKPVREPYIKWLDEAVDLLKTLLKENPNILITIVGDYDSDGINALAIMYWCLAAVKANVVLRVPRRFSEGYGLSEKIIDEIPSGLLLTVDNGIAALSAIKKAKEKGLTVIVTDHHMPVKNSDGQIVLPEADVIVNPHVDNESEFQDYCGAAIAYRFAAKFLGTKLPSLLVLASIATITDVMPLVGANHTLVRDGLYLLNHRRVVPGLETMLRKLYIDGHATEEDYGFKIGPMLNAPGRLYDNGAESAVKLLCSKRTDFSIESKVDSLIKTNERRKELVKMHMESVKLTLNKTEKPVVVLGKNIPEGIVGLIAGKLSEELYCPVIVFSAGHEPGVLKGSGRSIPGINLKDCLDKIQSEMIKYGGHAGAAGLSIREDNFVHFATAFKDAVGVIPEKPEPAYDLDLDLDQLDAVADEQDSFAPYGEGNPRILFHCRFYVSDNLWKRIGDGSHFLIKGERITLLGFGLADLYEEMGCPAEFNAIGYLSSNWFGNSKSYQFEVIGIEA